MVNRLISLAQGKPTHLSANPRRIGKACYFNDLGTSPSNNLLRILESPIDYCAHAQIVGDNDEMAVSNDPSSMPDFKEQYVPVKVVAAGTAWTDMLTLAAKTASGSWYHSFWGNWFPNFFGGQCTGRRDHWADWLNGWIQNHNYGEVRKIEKCFFNVTEVGFRHVSLRITLCETNEIFYVDGHANPDDPVRSKDEYEDERSEPEDVWTTYSR